MDRVKLTPEHLIRLRDEYRKRFLGWKPYPKQLAFHNSRERKICLSGGNQTGKTQTNLMQLAFHATGVYPSWYEGVKMTPVYNDMTGKSSLYLLVAGTDAETVRDSIQTRLIGSKENGFKDGLIHNDYMRVDSFIKKQGVANAVQQVTIDRVDGTEVVLFFKTYAQGRSNLQSMPYDYVMFDEEPPQDVYGELVARVAARVKVGNGYIAMGFTPLSGATEVVLSFWKNDKAIRAGKKHNSDMRLICLSILDCEHMDPVIISNMYSDLTRAERNARMHGVPTTASGKIYSYDINEITGRCPPSIIKDCKRLGAIDFGRGMHHNAVIYLAIDDHTNIIYVTNAWKTLDKDISQVASMMKAVDAKIPVAYPHDLNKKTGISKLGREEKGSEGHSYKMEYEDEGITMTPENAKTDTGSVGVENGITLVRRYIRLGLLKIDPSIVDMFEDELDLYRYGDDGKPIKKNDDLLDALRYAIIMIRHAVVISSRREMNKNNKGKIKDETPVN